MFCLNGLNKKDFKDVLIVCIDCTTFPFKNFAILFDNIPIFKVINISLDYNIHWKCNKKPSILYKIIISFTFLNRQGLS